MATTVRQLLDFKENYLNNSRDEVLKKDTIRNIKEFKYDNLEDNKELFPKDYWKDYKETLLKNINKNFNKKILIETLKHLTTAFNCNSLLDDTITNNEFQVLYMQSFFYTNKSVMENIINKKKEWIRKTSKKERDCKLSEFERTKKDFINESVNRMIKMEQKEFSNFTMSAIKAMNNLRKDAKGDFYIKSEGIEYQLYLISKDKLFKDYLLRDLKKGLKKILSLASFQGFIENVLSYSDVINIDIVDVEGNYLNDSLSIEKYFNFQLDNIVYERMIDIHENFITLLGYFPQESYERRW